MFDPVIADLNRYLSECEQAEAEGEAAERLMEENPDLSFDDALEIVRDRAYYNDRYDTRDDYPY